MSRLQERRGQAQGVAQSPAEQREAQRQAWLDRATEILDSTQSCVESEAVTDPVRINASLKTLLDSAAGVPCLNPSDRESLAARVKTIGFVAFERTFEHVLAAGRAVIRGNDPKALAPLMKMAGDLIGELRKIGLDQAGCDSLKEKLQILRETAHPGESTKAKAAKIDLGPKAYAGERRMFVRYTDPSLFVTFAGHCFRSVDWSLGGMLLTGVEHLPAAIGHTLAVKLKVEGGKLHDGLGKIVRYNEDRKELALQFRRFDPVLLAIKKECMALGIEPS